jgi:hypothetical protein
MSHLLTVENKQTLSAWLGKPATDDVVARLLAATEEEMTLHGRVPLPNDVVERLMIKARVSLGRAARETPAERPPDRGMEALKAPEPTAVGRQITLRGRSYGLSADDALTLFGALAMAVDGETCQVKLASGDVLELTHQDVSDIGRQLAGKPADEVSGSDRGA